MPLRHPKVSLPKHHPRSSHLAALPGRQRWASISILLMIVPPTFAKAPITHPTDDPSIVTAKNDPFYAVSSSKDHWSQPNWPPPLWHNPPWAWPAPLHHTTRCR